MTEPTAPSASDAAKASPPAPVSFWEDLIDIFVSPAAVFRRRENGSAWPPLLFVSIALAVITFATFNAIQPAMDAEATRAMTKAMAASPQMTQEMANKMLAIQDTAIRYAPIIVVPITLFILGVIVWLVSKLFSARETFNAAVVVTSYAYMPRVIGAVVAGAIGLLSDPTKLTGMASLGVSPARFFDAATTNPFLMAVLNRLDIFVIWETVLIAIGISVTGRISKGSAAVFGVVIWIIGGLLLLRQALA
jgi:hypothetical protein